MAKVSKRRAPRSSPRKGISGNKKVRNARKYDSSGTIITDYKGWREKNPDDICLDSKLEYMCYKTLTDMNIRFELKRKYTIIPSFEFHGEKVRAITWTPDFYLIDYDYLLETKGYANDGFGNKLKTMKYHLYTTKSKTRIAICRTQAEVQSFLNTLVSRV
jgi:hypothetical protein